MPGEIGAALWPIDPDATDTAYSVLVLEAIHSAYRTPTPLTLGEYSVLDSLATASAFSAIEFTRTTMGSVENVRVVGSSLSPVFDQAAVDAVLAAGARGLPPLPAGTRTAVQYRLHVTIFANRGTVVKGGYAPGTVSARWLDTEVPAWGGAQPVGVVKDGGTPEYPEVARHARVEDSLAVTFAVGPNGRITPGTGVVMYGTYHEFVESISRWLRAKTFRPATIGGCAVTALVEEPFRFKMAR